VVSLDVIWIQLKVVTVLFSRVHVGSEILGPLIGGAEKVKLAGWVRKVEGGA
jgi:hypothetical protein